MSFLYKEEREKSSDGIFRTWLLTTPFCLVLFWISSQTVSSEDRDLSSFYLYTPAPPSRESKAHSCLLFSHSVVSNSFWPHGLQHPRLPCPSVSPTVCSNSCPSSWCHPTISASVALFSSCPQSFQHHSLFQWVSQSILAFHLVAKVLELQLQHQSFQ